jgi:dolichyl-diphosphooligosaccharide--protein glycosyltransferase
MNLKVPDSLKRLKIANMNLLVYATLFSIVLLVVAIRLLPLQWGIHLEEFDPYIQYKGASYVVENGFNAWYTWFDPTRWAPWGTNVPSQALFGVPFTGAALYMFLNFIGLNVRLFDVAVFFPVFAGAIMTILIFATGKELVNRGVGLLSAFIFAIDPTAIQRTALGFFDTESVGMLGMLVSILFFIKSLKTRTIPYSIIAGLGLAYMALSWGAYLFPLNLFALFVIIMAAIGRWSKQLSISFTVITAITMFTLAVAPSYGLDDVISPFTALPIIAFIICLVLSFTEYVKDPARRKKFSIGAILGIIVVIGALTLGGVFGPIGGKFLTFINPLSRAGIPIIGTVGEQFPSIWSNFFANYHILIILAPVGAYYALKRLKYKDLFMVLLALVAVYGAGTYIRLMIVVAPAISILGGFALTSLLSNVSFVVKQQPDKKSRASLLGKGYGILIIAIVIVAMAPLAYNLSSADRPTMIVSASSGYATEIPDWMETLAWMRDNLPQNAIIGCWWDYGYWINVMANKSVIADNSTTNGTQIKLIAQAFLNNETYALDVFKAMKVDYVVVYEPWTIVSQNPLIGLPPWVTIGDFEKSTAMMAIAGYNSTDYIKGILLSTSSGTINYPLPAGPKASNTTLYQLLFYPFIDGYNSTLKIDITAPQHFQLVYASSDLWVLVYKINYPA